MREIVLDTETTGFDAQGKDRIVEIGCIELLNHIPSGREWHSYIDPKRDMPQSAFEIHGLSGEFLTGKPEFERIAQDFLAFIARDRLIIHNASFDVGFLNAELKRAGGPPIHMNRVTDTLALARRKHPGAPNSLDALCKRYGVDISKRSVHGALIDCKLLASVYVELIGGHQARLELAAGAGAAPGTSTAKSGIAQRPEPLPPRLSEEEAEAHRSFVATLGPDALWHQFAENDASSR